MKVVINKCFGGFDLSDKAHERLIELGVKYYKSFDDLPKNNNELYVVNSCSHGLGKYYSNFSDYENRTNPLLIQVVEELKDDASGRFGNLKIVEIPNDIQWEIDEYDGIETIHELHRSW